MCDLKWISPWIFWHWTWMSTGRSYFTLSFICVEILNIVLRQNRHIEGKHIQREFCLFRYADDTIMFSNGTENSLKLALDSFSIFKIFGVKTKLWINQGLFDMVKIRKQWYLCFDFKIQWTNNDLNVLGIKFK